VAEQGNEIAGWQPLSAKLVERALAAGDPTGWFEPLYAAGRAGTVQMPWDRAVPFPFLMTALPEAAAAGQTAVVVGCGLGADAEELARRGFRTTAFDVSPSAVAEARERHLGTTVDYQVANLFDLPHHWNQAFDLVLEVVTVQSLPPSRQPEAAAAVAGLLAPGGDLLVIASARSGSADIALEDGPPWPLRRDDLLTFAVGGVTMIAVEETSTPRGPAWLARFTAPRGRA
jgi:SAM-dependent methyltransferase